METTEYMPPLDEARTLVTLPISSVTVLEDRAMVVRTGVISAKRGRLQLALLDVAPILQDVSLSAQTLSESARIADVRVRRALRVRRSERVEKIVALETEAERLDDRLTTALDRRARASSRSHRLWQMLTQGASELPEDAAWGRVDETVWRRTFQALFERVREQQSTLLDAHFEADDAADDLEALIARMALLDRPDISVAAWIEIDVSCEQDAPVELSVSYVVPNALWRPIHRAELRGDKLRYTIRSAIWQRTGEDWEGVKLYLSTARTALATEPPMLSDDLLRVTRKSEDVKLEAREVEIQTTGPGDAPADGQRPQPQGVELPGVDDGGEIRVLEIDGTVSVPSMGQPTFFDVSTFDSDARVERIAIAERIERVVIRCEATNTSALPVLAGPVELIRDHGAIGWTETPFVAPSARLELSFGPDDALRISREASLHREEVDRVDRWHRRDFWVDLFLSNLGLQPAVVTVIERVPVSEVEEVKVQILEGTTNKASPDLDGMVRFTISLAPGAKEKIKLRYQVATSPGAKL